MSAFGNVSVLGPHVTTAAVYAMALLEFENYELR